MRQRGRAHYHKRLSENPEAVREKQRAARVRQRADVDENVRIKRREWSRRERERIKQDPERMERRRAYDREYRRAWMALLRLDPARYEAWRAQRRETEREYQRIWKANLRAAMTPEQRQELIKAQRELRRQAALAELLSIVNRIQP